MIQLEKLTDLQLAKRMSDYIRMLQSITVRAEYYSLGNCPEKELNELIEDYGKLRSSIREESEYLNYGRNKKGSPLLWDKYFPSISEAAAWGLYAEPEDVFCKDFLKGVSDAEERLTKYYSYDYWQIIAEL